MGGKICKQCSSIDQWVIQKFKNSQHQWVKELDDGEKEQSKSNPDYRFIISKKVQGKGVLFKQGYYYEGDMNEEHEAEGNGQEFIKCEEDQIIYRGSFHKNERSGSGTYKDKNMILIGTWEEGKPVKGELKMKMAEGEAWMNVNSLTFFSKQLDKGKIQIKFANKAEYQGEFSKCKQLYSKYCFEGQGTMVFPDKSIYEGTWKQGKFDGKGAYKWGLEGLNKFEGTYKKGLKHGQGKYYLSKIKYIQGTWMEGKKQGPFQVIEIMTDGFQKRIDTIRFENDRIFDPSLIE